MSVCSLRVDTTRFDYFFNRMFLPLANNPDHLAKWSDFQERDLLRKLSLGLNDISLTGDQLINASGEELRKAADDFGESKTKENAPKFVICVPGIPKEFPHQAKKKTTTMYPLPISQENQCKTLGMAQNLDMFGEEFSFEKQKKKTFLQLRKSTKGFDLDAAYARYAFLKSMEKHKERQKISETRLRGDSHTEESADLADYAVVVCEESDSDCTPDSD